MLDDIYLYRLRIELNLIEILLGQSLNCLTNEQVQLNNPIDFSFNSQGDLIILEKAFPYIRILRSSNIQLETFNLNLPSPIKVQFSSIAFYPDHSILLANLGTKEIFQLKTISLTIDDEQVNGLNIPSKDTNEIYVFNRVGQHRATMNALTGIDLF